MSRSSRPNLIAYPLPSGEWNVVDANGSGNAYRVTLHAGRAPAIVNRRGQRLTPQGTTARNVLKAIDVKRQGR